MTQTGLFILNFDHCDLPFDLAQGGESFDSAQDREPVERLVEPFDIWNLLFGISIVSMYHPWQSVVENLAPAIEGKSLGHVSPTATHR